MFLMHFIIIHHMNMIKLYLIVYMEDFKLNYLSRIDEFDGLTQFESVVDFSSLFEVFSVAEAFSKVKENSEPTSTSLST